MDAYIVLLYTKHMLFTIFFYVNLCMHAALFVGMHPEGNSCRYAHSRAAAAIRGAIDSK
jgi:hypothetical protein